MQLLRKIPCCKESKFAVFRGSVVNFHLSQPEKFYWNEVKASDIIIYPHESTNTHKEMIEISVQCFDEALKDFKIDYITLTEVTSKKSKIVLEAIERAFVETCIDISKTRLTCLDEKISMSGKICLVFFGASAL